MRHVFSKLSFLIEFALCQKSSEYLGCLVNRKSGASLPHWLTSKWCKPPGPHWGLLRPPKRCKKMQRKSVLLIFLLNLWNITLIISILTLIVGAFKPFFCAIFSNAKFVLVFIFTFFDVWFKSTDWNPLTLISSPTLIFLFSPYRKCKLQTNYLMNRFWRASIIYKCSQKTAFNALSLPLTLL